MFGTIVTAAATPRPPRAPTTPELLIGNLTILLELEGNARILGGRRALCSRISEQKPRWCLEEVVTLQGEVFDNESRPFVRPDGLFDVPPCVVLVWEVPLWGKPDQVCVMMQLIGLLSELDPHRLNNRTRLLVLSPLSRWVARG